MQLDDIGSAQDRLCSSGSAYRLECNGLAFQRIPRAETRPAFFQRADSRFIRPIQSERPTNIVDEELEMTTECSLSKRKFADRRL